MMKLCSGNKEILRIRAEVKFMPEKAIPVGISNFQTLIQDNYLYVDKTKYIEIKVYLARYQIEI